MEDISSSNRRKYFMAVVLALAAVIIVYLYVNQLERFYLNQLTKNMETSEIFVATQNIKGAEIVDSSMVKKEKVPHRWIQPGALTSLVELEGKTAAVSIYKDEQITASKLGLEIDVGEKFSASIPLDKKALTISCDSLSSHAGMVKFGDFVDILATVRYEDMVGNQTVTKAETFTLLQHIKILAIGSKRGVLGKLVGEERYSTLTLAVSPDEAEKIIFLESNGQLRLLLRRSGDSKIEEMPIISMKDIIKQRNFTVQDQPEQDTPPKNE